MEEYPKCPGCGKKEFATLGLYGFGTDPYCESCETLIMYEDVKIAKNGVLLLQEELWSETECRAIQNY